MNYKYLKTVNSTWAKALLLVTLCLCQLSVSAQYTWSMIGDVNGDRAVDVADIASIIDVMASGNSTINASTKADVNGDGAVDVADIAAVISIMASSNLTSYLTCPDEHHPHLIDLGLPSGKLWSCCNVGANNPGDYGGYFAWGELVEKDDYDWPSYSLCNGDENSCYHIGDTISATDYDVAHVLMHGRWNLPTPEDFLELKKMCSTEWGPYNGAVNCVLFTGPLGNSIILPMGGLYFESERYYECSAVAFVLGAPALGVYWTSITDFSKEPYRAQSFVLGADIGYNEYNERCYGLNIRPVVQRFLQLSSYSSQIFIGDKDTIDIVHGNGKYIVESSDSNIVTAFVEDNSVVVSAIKYGDAIIKVTDIQSGESAMVKVTTTICPDENHPHMVDLGLPSGVKWACCNVGTNVPEGRGGFYAWGETKEKSSYTDENYIHSDGTFDTCYDLGSSISGTDYDVARVEWYNAWQMPTNEHFEELISNCTYEWITFNDKKGILFTGPTGNSIFLPDAGVKFYNIHLSGIDYWSGNSNPDNIGRAYEFVNDNDTLQLTTTPRANGCTVRPVLQNINSLQNVLALSNTSITLMSGESKNVMILTGSGKYVAESYNEKVAQCSVNGNAIIIEALQEGDTKIEVYDYETRLNTFLKVRVLLNTCPDNNHPHIVDLDLPSGTKWACCNVGAHSPEKYGDYYAWGEISTKNTYSLNNYTLKEPYESGSSPWEGFYDIGTNIEGTDYDVAHLKWGQDWVMPRTKAFQELIDNCTYNKTTTNGVRGYKFTGRNGNVLFLPCAGHRSQSEHSYEGSSGYYWSSSVQGLGTSIRACELYFSYDSYDTRAEVSSSERHIGQSIRPIQLGVFKLSLSSNVVELFEGKSTTIEITSGNDSYIIESDSSIITVELNGNTITVIAVHSGDATITVTDTETGLSETITVTVTKPLCPFCPDGNHPHMIDLGLPSGTKWACCNVGASVPDDYGDYYTFDEAQTFNPPLKVHLEELIDNCTSEWTQLNGENGRRFIGPNGNSIFLPAAGGIPWYSAGSSASNVGSNGYYWSSSPTDEYNGYGLGFDSSGANWRDYGRDNGSSVRPVHFHSSQLTLSDNVIELDCGETATVEITSGNDGYEVSEDSRAAQAIVSGNTIVVTGLSAGTAIITVTDNYEHTATITVTVKEASSNHAPEGLVAVDLGLPSGTLWANMNVGAKRPEDYGLYYAWGETETKEVYSDYTYHVNIGSDIAGTEYDAATANWGAPWRMPSKDQMQELIDNTTSEWTTQNGMYGWKFIGSNGGTIFLPAAGYIWDDWVGLNSAAWYGIYWSSTHDGRGVWALDFDSEEGLRMQSWYIRYLGYSVRPVR